MAPTDGGVSFLETTSFWTRMDASDDDLIRRAAALARGEDPETGEQVMPQQHLMADRTARDPRAQPERLAAERPLEMSEQSRAMLKSFAAAAAEARPMLPLDDYLARRRAEVHNSLAAIGASDGEAWQLLKLQWTLEYWRQRALLAESRLERMRKA
jgi:hypothetical protein